MVSLQKQLSSSALELASHTKTKYNFSNNNPTLQHNTSIDRLQLQVVLVSVSRLSVTSNMMISIEIFKTTKHSADTCCLCARKTTRRTRASHSAAHLHDLTPLTDHHSLAFMERARSSSVVGASLPLETKEFRLLSLKQTFFAAHCCVLTFI